MEELRIIYRLMKAIEQYDRAEEKSLTHFEPERLKTTGRERDRLLLKLIKAGYVDGMTVIGGIDNMQEPCVMWSRSRPSLTLAGLEYLESNSMMKKAK